MSVVTTWCSSTASAAEVLAVLIGLPLHGRVEQLLLERRMDLEFGEHLFGEALLFLVGPLSRCLVLFEEGLHFLVVVFQQLDGVRHVCAPVVSL
jgi:hypothetical protein